MKIPNTLLIIPVLSMFVIGSLLSSCSKDSQLAESKITINDSEYIRGNVDGVSFNFTRPVDSVISPRNVEMALFGYNLRNQVTGYNSLGSLAKLYFGEYQPSQTGDSVLINIFLAPGFEGYRSGNPVGVNQSFFAHITEYGPAGQYIAGYFAAAMPTYVSPNNVSNITCQFRYKY